MTQDTKQMTDAEVFTRHKAHSTHAIQHCIDELCQAYMKGVKTFNQRFTNGEFDTLLASETSEKIETSEEFHNRMLAEGKTFYKVSGKYLGSPTFTGVWHESLNSAFDWAKNLGFESITVEEWK